jgi:nitronate monooxygenase
MTATLATRLTERLGIEHPIVSAPMAFAGGGALAAAVTAAGGLGLIGGGYGNADWLAKELDAAGNRRVGCGFITWALAERPALLDQVLERSPAAVMLSFGDPAPFAPAIRAADSLLICQVQNLAHLRAALAAGADIVVAQGSEAGGHGATRGTLTLVPEVADLLAAESPSTLLLAAGGIGDGRGLAAALMLGADGVLMGSRFWGCPRGAGPSATPCGGSGCRRRCDRSPDRRRYRARPGLAGRVHRPSPSQRLHRALARSGGGASAHRRVRAAGLSRAGRGRRPGQCRHLHR